MFTFSWGPQMRLESRSGISRSGQRKGSQRGGGTGEESVGTNLTSEKVKDVGRLMRDRGSDSLFSWLDGGVVEG